QFGHFRCRLCRSRNRVRPTCRRYRVMPLKTCRYGERIYLSCQVRIRMIGGIPELPSSMCIVLLMDNIGTRFRCHSTPLHSRYQKTFSTRLTETSYTCGCFPKACNDQNQAARGYLSCFINVLGTGHLERFFTHVVSFPLCSCSWRIDGARLAPWRLSVGQKNNANGAVAELRMALVCATPPTTRSSRFPSFRFFWTALYQEISRATWRPC